MDKAGAIMAQMKLERKYVNLLGLNGTQPRNIGFRSKHEKHVEDVWVHSEGEGVTGSAGLCIESGNCAWMLHDQPVDQLLFKVKKNEKQD